jgi:signal transduction histidine kinase/CheY-like chemotaxis protein
MTNHKQTGAHRPSSALQTDVLEHAIYNNAHFCYIATDAAGVIQIFNVGAERMLGYSDHEVIGSVTPDDLADPQEIAARAQALRAELDTDCPPGLPTLLFKAAQGFEDIVELTFLCKDGARLAASVSVSALRDNEEGIIGYLLIGTDNTERKRAEAERKQLEQVLQEKNGELELSRAAAEKANQAKSEFLSNMSHELRTPLNAVLGFAQLMETATPQPSAAQKLSIEQILKGGWYLLRLINEILDLAMIESGKLAMVWEPMSLSEVLRDCQVMVAPQALSRNVAIDFAIGDAPHYVYADRTRIQQVMINLLSNAIKYNRDNGRASVRCEPLPDGRLRVSVQDTGIGLSAPQLKQLFQPFNRLGQEAGSTEGTGIGLVVTKQLVELMGGTLGVDSVVGEGSTFWFELVSTVADAPALQAVQPVPVTQLGGAPHARMRTLLYVEDNLANVSLVEQLIERRSDLTLLVASNGEDGIEMARAQRPDVILMDINLPGISGLEALKSLRTDGLTAHIPVLALSANAIQNDIDHGLEAGFFRYLTKPIKIDEFMQALDIALDFAASQALEPTENEQ